MQLRRFATGRSASPVALVVGFGRQGWPLMQFEDQQLLMKPPETLVMRGQQWKLHLVDDEWQILEPVEELGKLPKKKCIHPTRVAALCKNCPRRKKRS